MNPPSMESRRFLIFGMMTYSSFYVTVFPNGPLLRVHSYSVGGRVTDSWKNIYLYHGEPVDSFALNREKKHLGGRGIWALGRIGRGGIRGEKCPGIPRPIHCLGPASFRAWSHRGPWAGFV